MTAPPDAPPPPQGQPARRPPRYALHVALFVATLLTTTLSIGLWYGLSWAADRLAPVLADLPDQVGLLTVVGHALASGHLDAAAFLEEVFVYGGMYSSSLLTILLSHEMGHYVLARRHGVDVSPPYFIPAPPLLSFGTFGAFIRLREPVTDRRALMDIGAAGPIAGLLVAVPVLLYGLTLSEVRPLSPGGLYEGNSLLYLAAKWLIWGPVPVGSDVFLHPVAFAGWVGLLVTALNLFPIGQLDGGHVAYALLGDRAVSINRAVFGGLLGLGLGLFLFKGQAIWAVWALIIVMTGIEHPPMSDLSAPLDRRRRALGWACLLVFVLSFTPIPMSDEPPGGPDAIPSTPAATSGQSETDAGPLP